MTGLKVATRDVQVLRLIDSTLLSTSDPKLRKMGLTE